MNKISTELIIVIVAILFFYLRIALLRGKKKRMERELALTRRKVKGRSKGAALPQKPKGSPNFNVTNWFLVALTVLIILAGVIMYNQMVLFGISLVKDAEFIATYSKFWYIPVALGIIALSFCITIDKPRLDDEAD
ncbi:MAG TPA: hypothetical protein PK040_06060 [Anaerolineaceae bacterium]|nr:hypothetical protein [Anaerolineaceae bacterium]